jgi:hypothetical protein
MRWSLIVAVAALMTSAKADRLDFTSMVLIPEGKSAIELAQLGASVALPIISFVAVLVAIWAIKANRRTQREQTARNAYIKYIELAFQNPEFAFPDWSKIDLEHQVFISDDTVKATKDFEKYEWFMSILLNTANFVFTTVRPNHILAKQMRLQFAYHWRYIEAFKSNKNYFKFWYSQHRKQIDEGVKFGKQEYP